MNDTIESLKRYITHDSSFVCVCNSISYSSLRSAKYQIALAFVPKLEPTAEESYQHSVLWRMHVCQQMAWVTRLFIKTADYKRGNVSVLQGPLMH